MKPSKGTIKASDPLAKCKDCGAQTEALIPIKDVPREVSVTGTVTLPFCQPCFERSPFYRYTQN